MGRRIDVEDLVDAGEVAELLGLAGANVVSVYQKRYEDMPRPVVQRPSGRCLLWLRSDIEKWARRARRLP